MTDESLVKRILKEYPLTVWCNERGLIGYGDPVVGDLGGGDRIYFLKEKLTHDKDILDAQSKTFTCPNCKKGSVLFRDVRLPDRWVTSPWYGGVAVPVGSIVE